MVISFLFFMTCCHLCEQSSLINFYMPQSQVQKIYGIDGELYYIRKNKPNWQAIQHEVVIPENVDYVKFRWQDEQALTQLVPPTWFSMSLEMTDNKVLSAMRTNLNKRGKLPRIDEKEFNLTFQCQPKVTGSTLVHFNVNFSVVQSWSKSDEKILSLSFTFKKMCMDTTYIDEKNREALRRDTQIKVFHPKKSATNDMNSSYFYITVGVVCTVFFIAATSLAFLHMSSMSKLADEVKHGLIGSESSVEGPVKAIPHVVRATLAEQKLQELTVRLQDFSIRRNLLSLGYTVQEGSYGRTYVGSLYSADYGDDLKVLVKTVTDSASPEQTALFLLDSSLLKRTIHHNVLPLLYVCLDAGELPIIVYPHMNRGNLKNYLRLSRTTELLAKPLTTRDIVLMSLQIANGLQYIGRRRLIHKDIASRNCMVDEDLHVKICDTALSRDFFPDDYHCLGDNDNRPVRWLAAECLETNTYLFASDVWSYGVLLWELSSLAQTPYASVDPFDMLSYLKSGLRLPQPLHCPDDFFAVMACCWALTPEDRPHISQIIPCLDAFLNTLNAFI